MKVYIVIRDGYNDYHGYEDRKIVGVEFDKNRAEEIRKREDKFWKKCRLGHEIEEWEVL